uniref:Plastid light harvesting protein n=1 Tax=Chromera velia CCMP2878 TaxID=1169474 RepID=A0A0G4GV87_9ALVE|mmetsp:Transcript_29335/g.57578  ORF Transcript_29335/g.57578 Transcript_29335/m.57578 type:complete len:313 (+) Transcript_29335:70-1008(+)|eukprot:Cvel_5242.t1-p1 / transcript=Cvel_5242.t1 / gene=Cvel_5242 / organism=Chromera_velia_CCMP2878 / gene_product=Chlorophyll a-b binding protein L1818,, putative / transcript_product=Chlorophyll a-b binding protein L1818,, putative / location=Cvel_scaffold241:79947-82925(+) / protein_length=312 / sequence_SO=supercontig / SO=protein_coding / is_pseudo=false
MWLRSVFIPAAFAGSAELAAGFQTSYRLQNGQRRPSLRLSSKDDYEGSERVAAPSIDVFTGDEEAGSAYFSEDVNTAQEYAYQKSKLDKDFTNTGTQMSYTSNTRVDMDNPLGVTFASPEMIAKLPGKGPTGFFDPLGLATILGTENELRRWREAELKHGRVAMLATVGHVLQERIHPFFPDVQVPPQAPAQFDAFNDAVGGAFGVGLLAFILLLESYGIARGWGNPLADGAFSLKEARDYEPGNWGFDPLGLFPKDDEKAQLRYREQELNHGRTCMVAIAVFWLQYLSLFSDDIFNAIFGVRTRIDPLIQE